MPKTKVGGHVPFWDDLVAELGDPRPYDPTKIENSYEPDVEPFVDPDYFDELIYELSVQGEDAMSAVDGWRELAIDDLDKIWEWPPHVVEYRNMTEITTQFAAVGALIGDDEKE